MNRHAVPDRSVSMLRRGYPYLLDLRRRHGPEAGEIRIQGRRATVLGDADGARLFYDESVCRRRDAVPGPLRRTLFGEGAVHGLDDADHRHRKAMFLELLTAAAAESIATRAAAGWRRHADTEVVPARIFDEAVEVHSAAVCAWAGVPEDAVPSHLARELALIVDGFGSIGTRGLRARRARRRTDRWARDLIEAVCTGRVRVAAGSAVDTIARHRHGDGRPLPAPVAAVELINILRPTVAVAYFVAFTAHALAEQPELRGRLAAGGDDVHEAFAHEVRRYYPFVPMLAARVRRDVTYHGRRLPPGRRLLLDVYGMLHDPDLWPDAGRFDVERFVGTDPDPYRYVPQGGGAVTGHRCPGERIAVELIKAAARHLVADRPPVGSERAGDIPLNRIPTRPRPAGRR